MTSERAVSPDPPSHSLQANSGGGETRATPVAGVLPHSHAWERDPGGEDEDARTLLELQGVTRRFGSLRAVDNVSLTVRAGDRHALIGPNGAGKSTLFNMIAGTTEVSEGRILFQGEEITRLPEYRRSRLGIGKTFQHSNVFNGLSAFTNVAIPVQQRAGLAHNVFRSAARCRGVTERAMALLGTVGLTERAKVPAGALSHGERRQLEVAMTLATEPTLMLLDEPTAGMSCAESSAFVAMIGSLPRTLTVVIIEHDIDVVFALANRISVLHVGRLLADGTPGEIRASAEVQEAYLGGERTAELFASNE